MISRSINITHLANVMYTTMINFGKGNWTVNYAHPRSLIHCLKDLVT